MGFPYRVFTALAVFLLIAASTCLMEGMIQEPGFNEPIMGDGTPPGDVDAFRTSGGDVLQLSTLFGGEYNDSASKAMVNSRGEIVMVGSTRGDDLPITSDAPQKTPGGSMDAFVAVFSADGSTLLFCTYFGGSATDFVSSMTLDEDDMVYLAGVTNSTDLPTTEGCYQPENAGYFDVFVCKMDISDGTFIYSTYLGGSFYEVYTVDGTRTIMVNVNSTGCAWVVGLTGSEDFPVTSGCFQDQYDDEGDVFVAGLSVDGSELEYSTYLGGYNMDVALESQMGHDDDLLLIGTTSSGNFPTTSGVYQSKRPGDDDGFIVRFSTSNQTLVWSTFLGGPHRDILTSIREGPDGELYLTGYSESPSFPTTPGAYQENRSGRYDSVVCKLSGDGTWLVWSTYVGGTETDLAIDLCLLDDGSVCVLGYTRSDDHPVTAGAVQHEFGGDIDGTVLVLKGDGSELLYSTYLGGIGYDRTSTVVSLGDMTVLVAGRTNSPEFPVTEGAYDVDQEIEEAYVAKLWFDLDTPVAVAGPDVEVDQGDTVHLDGSASQDNEGIIEFTWTFDEGGTAVSLQGATAEHIFDNAGVFNVTLTVEDDGGRTASDVLVVTVRDITRPVSDAGGPIFVDQGTNVTLDAHNSTDNVGIVQWVWNFTYNGSSVKIEGAELTWTFDILGRHWITLEVIDAVGLRDTDEVAVTVIDIEPPVADAGEDRTVDQGGTVTFDGSNSTDNKGIVRWTWTFLYNGQDRELEDETTSHVFDTPGDYIIHLTARDHIGNSDEDSFSLHVRDTQAPTVPTIDDREVGSGDRIAFSSLGAVDNVGIVNWTWTFKEGGRTVVLDGEEGHHVFDEAGEYLVTLTVEDAEGNSAHGSFTVTVTGTTWAYWGLLIIVLAVLIVLVVYYIRSTKGDRT